MRCCVRVVPGELVDRVRPDELAGWEMSVEGSDDEGGRTLSLEAPSTEAAKAKVARLLVVEKQVADEWLAHPCDDD
jgi:hypothetical protein